MRARGFTILEALLALLILSAVLVVCLDLRSRALRQGERIDGVRLAVSDRAAITDMVAAGLLGEAEIDAERGVAVWRGTHRGEPFVVEARPVPAPNPVAETARGDGVAPRVRVWRYEITHRGETHDFLWY